VRFIARATRSRGKMRATRFIVAKLSFSSFLGFEGCFILGKKDFIYHGTTSPLYLFPWQFLLKQLEPKI